MAEDSGVILTEDAYERTREAVMAWERVERPGRAARGTGRAGGAETALARCTSAVANADGTYPAVVTWHDGAAWKDALAPCGLRMADGSVPASGTRYLVRPTGSASGAMAYVAEGAAGGGSAFASWATYQATYLGFAALDPGGAGAGPFTANLTIATLPAGTHILAAYLRVLTPFGGGAISAYDCQLYRYNASPAALNVAAGGQYPVVWQDVDCTVQDATSNSASDGSGGTSPGMGIDWPVRYATTLVLASDTLGAHHGAATAGLLEVRVLSGSP